MNTQIGSWINNRQSLPEAARQGDITNPATGQIIRQVAFANPAAVNQARAGASNFADRL